MSFVTRLLATFLTLLLIAVLSNVITQLFFKNSRRPPVVWHLFPKIGSTVDYGRDPYAFFFKCREKYGDIFTFTLIGMKVTVYLGTAGNNFILNGKHKDLNAEEIYGPLTVPTFGKGVVYDVDNARFMDQKRLLKEAFTSSSLRSYIPLFINEVESYIAQNPVFTAFSGICDISTVFGEIALYCAASSLQGPEVRDAFDSTFATLYRQLDDAFIPVNFMFPGLPLPVNRRRDHAQQKMAALYMDIIRRRRKTGKAATQQSQDVLWALLDATYKDGKPLADPEIANLMIALLMGGQHNTAASGAWIMLHLANKPHLIQELYTEQQSILGPDRARHPSYDDLQELSLHNAVIKETLRLHSPIHSVMRKVKTAMPIPGTDMVVPAGHVLLAAPSFPSRCEEYFSNAMEWNPHRWLSSSSSEDQYANHDRTTNEDSVETSKGASSPYLPFGAGRHRCVGETFAYAQLTAILATLVRLLKWEQLDPTADVPNTDYSSMFSRPVHPASIRWQKRAGLI